MSPDHEDYRPRRPTRQADLPAVELVPTISGGLECGQLPLLRMDLAGQHSNPSSSLRALRDEARSERHRVECAPLRQDVERPDADIAGKHRRHDWVQDAVVRVRVLEASHVSMHARDVHAAFEALLGEPVRWGSVKACLAANVAGESHRFIRVAPGRYSATARPACAAGRELLSVG